MASRNRVSRVAELTGRTLADMRKLDPEDGSPPYQQVAGLLLSDLRAGELVPGGQSPSLQAPSKTYDVSVDAVKSDLAVLRDGGRIVTQHGRGSFVRTSLPAAAPGPDSLDDVCRAIEQLTVRMDAVERRLSDR